MSTYVLIHGAGSDSWYWHLVVPELRGRGHDVVAPDLPCDDDAAGLREYTNAVVEAMAGHDTSDVVLVAQSLGGFTAPLVCEQVPVRLVILVAAMVPQPGELLGDWWDNIGWAEARQEQAERDGTTPVGMDDIEGMFLHDLPPDLKAEAMHHGRDQSGTPFSERWPLAAWPAVPTRAVLCRDDRLFPPELQRRVAKERLGITPEEIDGGHLPALSRPKELTAVLERLRVGS
ncbi:MAG TPA: alpha/beta hydrolase [Acidimicrobiia bacterium]|nr:alpha/beta hydrolase [Acidimicrobiia bacterium]